MLALIDPFYHNEKSDSYLADDLDIYSMSLGPMADLNHSVFYHQLYNIELWPTFCLHQTGTLKNQSISRVKM